MVKLSNSYVFLIKTRVGFQTGKRGVVLKKRERERKKTKINILHEPWERISANIWDVLQLDFILILN